MKFTDLLAISTLVVPLSLAACDKEEEGTSSDDGAEEANGSEEAATSEEGATSDEGVTSEGEVTTAAEEGPAEEGPAEEGTTVAEEGPAEEGPAEEGTTVAEEGPAEEGPAEEGTTGEGLSWYTSCGDPVCSGYGGPWEGVPTCGDIKEGDPCEAEGETCDFMSECNAVMICAASDPKMQEGGCPISRAEFKQDIAYLDASERDAFYRQVLDMRMATWRYRDRTDGKNHLGVILEDGEDQVWADPAHDRVDLYSYGSLAIVGVQTQAGEIAELKAAVSALQSEVVTLREQAARCK